MCIFPLSRDEIHRPGPRTVLCHTVSSWITRRSDKLEKSVVSKYASILWIPPQNAQIALHRALPRRFAQRAHRALPRRFARRAHRALPRRFARRAHRALPRRFARRAHRALPRRFARRAHRALPRRFARRAIDLWIPPQ